MELTQKILGVLGASAVHFFVAWVLKGTRSIRIAACAIVAASAVACGSTNGGVDSSNAGAPSSGSGGAASGGFSSLGSGGVEKGGASGTAGAPPASGGFIGGTGGGGSGAGPSGGGSTATGGAPSAILDSGGAPAQTETGTPTLFFLDALLGRVLRAKTDGSPSTAIATQGSYTPDGVAIDVPNGFVYWTNMGDPDTNDGFILRAKLDGSEETPIVPAGGTFTPKQLKLDADHGMLYWADREGMKVMRARVDGSNIETLVTIADGDTARADASNWAVGIALDLPSGQMYWTQKGPTDGGQGSIRRAGVEIPSGEDSATRTDIEVLFSGLPEPIDLDVDLSKRQIYWTDRGDNTVSRAPMDPPPGSNPATRTDRRILVHGAGQAIGISLDLAHDAMYYTSLDTGTVWTAALDGTGATALLLGQGSLTGIDRVDLP